MKFSEAIREGSKLRPQCFGKLSDGEGTCANGAAMEAIGAPFDSRLDRYFPIAADPKSCPVCGESDRRSVGQVCAHLNDHHHWTRERIADWVETIER